MDLTARLSRRNLMRRLISRKPLDEVEAIITEYETYIRLCWDVTQMSLYLLLASELLVGRSVTTLQAQAEKLSPSGLTDPGAVPADPQKNKPYQLPETEVSASGFSRNAFGAFSLGENKKSPILLAEPAQFPITTFDLNSHDDWIRRGMTKELRPKVEPMEAEETNIGPRGEYLVPQGRVDLTWSSNSPDSKSTSTFLVHTDLPSRIIFGSTLLSEMLASSSPVAFAFWRSKLTTAQTEELCKQHRQRNASLAQEQQTENRRKREEKSRAQQRIVLPGTSPGSAALASLGDSGAITMQVTEPPVFPTLESVISESSSRGESARDTTAGADKVNFVFEYC
ncbi:hypothetical protein PG994_001691 [Apiospora phragmitis]|uniref:Uncharacterized protein n=1 Tax=Apiospora phragmitis TaxID=2905665 RepID=A0ABR1WUE6_9PEZI